MKTYKENPFNQPKNLLSVKKKRAAYMTENRRQIIEFAKNNDNKVNKAQIMRLLNVSCDGSYDITKRMIEIGYLQKIGKCKFQLTDLSSIMYTDY